MCIYLFIYCSLQSTFHLKFSVFVVLFLNKPVFFPKNTCSPESRLPHMLKRFSVWKYRGKLILWKKLIYRDWWDIDPVRRSNYASHWNTFALASQYHSFITSDFSINLIYTILIIKLHLQILPEQRQVKTVPASGSDSMKTQTQHMHEWPHLCSCVVSKVPCFNGVTRHVLRLLQHILLKHIMLKHRVVTYILIKL